MSPVFTQEFVPDTQSQMSIFAATQSSQGSAETGRKVRASFTALSLAISLGATGTLVSSAEAADSTQLAALPSVNENLGTLPSVGSSRPDGASATYHTVADGETIWDIAKRHGVTVDDIKAANSIGGVQVIQAGQVLKVPTAALISAPAEIPAVVNLDATQEIAAVSAPSSHSLQGSLESFQVPGAADALEAPKADVAAAEIVAAGESIETRSPVTDNLVSASQSQSLPELSVSTPVEESSMALAELEVNTPVKQSEVAVVSPNVKPAANELRTTPLSSPTPDLVTHRVTTGETIWSIARSYGVTPAEIQAANRISNPNFIVSGTELRVPSRDTAEASPAIDTELRSHQRDDVTEQRQVVAAASEIAEEPLVITPTSEATIESVEDEPAQVAIADPFVEGLLSDVARATQSQTEITTASAERYASDVQDDLGDAPSAAQEIASAEDSDAVAVNPQFANEGNDNLGTLESGFAESELLAAAPLGSEVYSPMVESPEGQIVSPDMPVHPDQGEFLPEAPNRFDGYIWPAQGVLTSGYGWRWGRMHRGVDIAGPVGTPIYAAGPGVVVRSGWNSGGYGNLVDIRHPDGSLTRYAHNSQLLVREGQEVRQGQHIAAMGSTGFSTGPHLHFEIHLPNQGAINPMAMLPGR